MYNKSVMQVQFVVLLSKPIAYFSVLVAVAFVVA